MKYKVIVCDVDGTLINDKGEIPQNNIDAIKDYVKRGGQFIICTGRLAESVQHYSKIFGTENQKISVVGIQGAIIKNSEGESIYSATVPKDTAIKIITYCNQNGIYNHIYNDKDVFVEKKNEINQQYNRLTAAPIVEVGNLIEYIEKNNFSPHKIMSVIDNSQKDFLFSEYDKMSLPGVKYFMSSPIYFEFVPESAGKGNAVKKISEVLNIDISNIIAIGDNMNDNDMIQVAGLGVAVSNAVPSTLALADYITETDNNGGALAEIINKFCM